MSTRTGARPAARRRRSSKTCAQGGDALFVKVNFDDEKDFLRANRIPRQSTVLVFKGMEEVARSVAQTNRTQLRGVVLNAL